MANYPERLNIPMRLGVGSALALGSLVAGITIAEQPMKKHEIVMEMEYGEINTFHTSSIGRAVLSELSTVSAIPAIEARPAH